MSEAKFEPMPAPAVLEQEADLLRYENGVLKGKQVRQEQKIEAQKAEILALKQSLQEAQKIIDLQNAVICRD